jgi:hypothetical protein
MYTIIRISHLYYGTNKAYAIYGKVHIQQEVAGGQRYT